MPGEAWFGFSVCTVDFFKYTYLHGKPYKGGFVSWVRVGEFIIAKEQHLLAFIAMDALRRGKGGDFWLEDINNRIPLKWGGSAED